MNESEKTIQHLSYIQNTYMTGEGIDIGCGDSPVLPSVYTFDKEDGDARNICDYVTRRFDFVYSSHCLEHMEAPAAVLHEWWKLVNDGGHLIFIVPDEDLYEQGYWPSVFSGEHKSTFTIAKNSSWSPVSHNLTELVKSLPESELVQIELQDWHYQRTLQKLKPCPRWMALAASILHGKVSRTRCAPMFNRIARLLVRILPIPIDQTRGLASCQILCVVRKTNS